MKEEKYGYDISIFRPKVRKYLWQVLKRDVKFGLTPLHWLVVRFVDTMYEQFGERSFNYTSVQSIVRPERNTAGVDIFHSNRATLSPEMTGNTIAAEKNEEKVRKNCVSP